MLPLTDIQLKIGPIALDELIKQCLLWSVSGIAKHITVRHPVLRALAVLAGQAFRPWLGHTTHPCVISWR
ncbi:MAG: hypothetical protein ACPF9O_09220 [Cycloclasticus sp.]